MNEMTGSPKTSSMDVILTVISGRSSGRSLVVPPGGSVTVGRAERAELRVLDSGVSRGHCEIRNKGDLAEVSDLGSSNGTLLNGTLVETSVLGDGDELQIGMTTIRVEFRVVQPQRFETPAKLNLVEKTPIEEYSRRIVDIEKTSMMATVPNFVSVGQLELAQAHSALQTLCRVGYAINAERDLDSLFATIIDSTMDASGAEHAAILVYDPVSEKIAPAVTRHKEGTRETTFEVSGTVVEEVWRTGMSTITADASLDDRFKSSDSIIAQKIRSAMCVPLAAKELRLGVLYVDTTDVRRKFNERDLELLATIGAQAGMALERARLIENLEELFIGAIRALAASIDARDPYTRGHSERVTDYAMVIANVMGLQERERDIVALAGQMHDVGKIGVPEAVLNKPGKLTEEEFAVIKLHPGQGADIIRNIRHPYIDEVVSAVLHHHERCDGRGYPEGRPSAEFCRTSRILAVADTYDAMTSDRTYRTKFTEEKAVGILREVAGSQLDPEVVKAFLQARTAGAIAETAATPNAAVARIEPQ